MIDFRFCYIPLKSVWFCSKRQLNWLDSTSVFPDVGAEFSTHVSFWLLPFCWDPLGSAKKNLDRIYTNFKVYLKGKIL